MALLLTYISAFLLRLTLSLGFSISHAQDSEVFEISTPQEFDFELKAPIFQDALLHVYGSSPSEC